ncbi:MAG: hypothetical protein ACI9CF_000419, partial [Candidatus Omnitrophota bacterium]
MRQIIYKLLSNTISPYNSSKKKDILVLNITKKVLFIPLFMSILCAGSFNIAQASDVDILLNKLVERNILSTSDAENIRIEIRTEKAISNSAQSTPKGENWLNGLKSKGDLRLRYEGQSYENEDGKDRNRYRARLRWGLEKQVNDQWKAGFRISTGSSTAATSTNQTLDGESNFKDIFLNRAYAIYAPTQWAQENLNSNITKLELGGGKFNNPWKKWTTSIIWDSDIEPEGAYENISFKISDFADEGWWTLETQASQFILDESASGNDVEVNSYGIGTTFAWNKTHNLNLRFSYYDWQDYVDLIKSGSVLANQPNGNGTEVDDFKVISLYADYNVGINTPWWGKQNLSPFIHYIENLEEGNAVAMPGEDSGLSAGFKIGKAKKKGTWQTGYQYYALEANASPGAFTEGDLGRSAG